MTKKAPRGTRPDWSRVPGEGRDFLPVLAIDPGEGTGIALVFVPAESLYGDGEPCIWPVWNEEITGPENQQVQSEIVPLVIDIARRWGNYSQGLNTPPQAQRPFPLVVEDFSLRVFSRGAELLTPVRLTAKIDYAVNCTLSTPVTLIRQQAGDAIGTVDDEMMKDLSLYAPGQKNAQVAMKHAILFLRRARASAEMRKLCWGR